MSDEQKPNLEPIEEKDLGLKEKFIGGAEPEKKNDGGTAKKETIIFPENIAEKLEQKEGLAEKDETYSKILSDVNSAPQVVSNEDVSQDAMNVSQEADAQSKINNLVNLAQTKSIVHAVKVAKHLEDNYVLDEFHDRLLGQELHDALVAKGLIRPV
ncbi:MAG TPA: hypothetical protein VK255_04645, partial [Patescibacteria group bacterium]|nr:hypothetical protein [Patescibacteria group bacterium]